MTKNRLLRVSLVVACLGLSALGRAQTRPRSSLSTPPVPFMSPPEVSASPSLVDSNKPLETSAGQYQFGVTPNGLHVVGEITPDGLVQTLPNISHTEPRGAYLPGYG